METYDFAADLRQYDDEYAEAETVVRHDDVPPGRYQATVDRCYLSRAKSNNNPVLRWELVVAVGEHKGRRLFRTNALSTPDNRRWLKTDLATAGVDLPQLSALPIHLDRLIGVLLDVTVSVKGEGDQARTNVYFNKRIDRDGTTATAGHAGVSRGLSRF